MMSGNGGGYDDNGPEPDIAWEGAEERVLPIREPLLRGALLEGLARQREIFRALSDMRADLRAVLASQDARDAEVKMLRALQEGTAVHVARLDGWAEVTRDDARRARREARERGSFDPDATGPQFVINVDRGSHAEIETPRAVEAKEKSKRITVTTERAAWATAAVVVMVVAALLGRWSGRPVVVPEDHAPAGPAHEGK